MEEASDWEEATHPLVQTTEERRDVNDNDGGGKDAAAAAGPEPCQSIVVKMSGRHGIQRRTDAAHRSDEKNERAKFE